MKLLFITIFILALSPINISANDGRSCEIAAKRFAFAKAKLELAIENLQAFIKAKLGAGINSSQNVKLKVDDKTIRTVGNIAVSAAAYEALLDLCKNPVNMKSGSLQQELLRKPEDRLKEGGEDEFVQEGIRVMP